MNLYVTADRQRFVPEGHPDAVFGVAPGDIDRLGLREAYEAFVGQKVKAMRHPADKAMRHPADK